MSQEGCLSTVRTWVAAALTCKGDLHPEPCVCSRENLDIARGLGDAALFLRSTDASLFGLVTTTVKDGSSDCFAGAFAEILVPVDDNDGDVGSPG